MFPPGLWSSFLHSSPTERSHTTVWPSSSMGMSGNMAALQEMLAAQPGSQASSMRSKSPPGLVKLGFPESRQPVHPQSSTHGMPVGAVVVTAVVGFGVSVDVTVVAVVVVVGSRKGVGEVVAGVEVSVVVVVVVGLGVGGVGHLSIGRQQLTRIS